MSYRGSRGKPQGGGADYGKPEPFVIFPDITLPDPKSISTDSQLVQTYFSFNKFWRNSPYHLGDGVSKKENESLDIERYSDSLKPKMKSNKNGSFFDFLVLRPDNFPKELLGDARRERPVKRAKWSQEADLQKLDVFEKLEAKFKAEGNEVKGEGEDDEEVEESEGEESDNGDYDQTQDFDDDDDDYNLADDGEFEDVYFFGE
ncbi:DNA-directed RNA polymerase III subunit Rpc31 [Arabidopsis suecica]|uniref:DNA-directed RNA polymerase III subunit Rpc31 n=1 Tax=Arabidopsis suecica TaxID=45249 RepID=A0A8T1ZG30_ARASU|nr:DNA-directed RNA polymerase III subunit Rpc31 [Arabidopsis suecica]